MTYSESEVGRLPLELLERVLHLTPVSQHANFSRVCKHWHDVINDPSMKRQVLIDLTNVESAWHTHLGNEFAVNAFSNSSSALEVYTHVIIKWMSQFVSRRTRQLTLSDDLCSKAHLLWPEFLPFLMRSCPNLQSITFQNGVVRVGVLQNLPPTVTRVRLDNVRVMKRHEEENYTECLVDLRQTFREVVLPSAFVKRNLKVEQSSHDGSLYDCFWTHS